MIELNSVIVILMAEALVALLLLLVGLWLWSWKKKSGDYLVARSLIDELDESKTVRTDSLEKLIIENGVVEPELQTLLKDIAIREKALYRQIIQLYLNRDQQLLKAVDTTIQDLALPYCTILKLAGSNVAALVDSETKNTLAAARQEITQLTAENASLSEQLRLALKTVDEISDEYTRIFNGNKHEAELRASYQRLVQVFQTMELEVKRSQVLL